VEDGYFGAKQLSPADRPRTFEGFCDHLGDRALGKFFVPPSQRSAVQVHQALGIGRKRFDLAQRKRGGPKAALSLATIDDPTLRQRPPGARGGPPGGLAVRSRPS
jgi:hypothetical protein